MRTFIEVFDTKNGESHTSNAGLLTGPEARRDALLTAERLFPRSKKEYRPVCALGTRVALVVVRP